MPKHHGANGTGKLEKALDFHLQAVAALQLAIQLVNGRAEHSSQTRMNGTIRNALRLDHARTKERPHGGTNKAEKLAKRKATAKFLARFDADTPMPNPSTDKGGNGIGVLMAHGYLKKKGDGYVRTSKEFRP